MPLDSKLVGNCLGPIFHTADRRWMMAYAASLNDLNPKFVDTSAHNIIAHPMFPVCLEWPLIKDMKAFPDSGLLTQQECMSVVHASHDLHVLRPIREGDELETKVTIVGLEEIKPGTACYFRLNTLDRNTRELVAQTFQVGIYRGVRMIGEGRFVETIPRFPSYKPDRFDVKMEIPTSAGLAHTYTECARIWNPVHTDKRAAENAGLSETILHGTATMGLAVSCLVKEFAGGDPQRVIRIGGRFTGMVFMPSTLFLYAHKQNDAVFFQMKTEQGQVAIEDGLVVLQLNN